jgi:hypothetical protein
LSPLSLSPPHSFSLSPLQPRPQEKNKKRGRNKISAKLRRKQKNVIDSQSLKLKEKLKETSTAPKKDVAVSAPQGALARFAKKPSSS